MASPRSVSQKLNGKKPPKSRSLNEMAKRGSKKKK